jgi:hypothetical protein
MLIKTYNLEPQNGRKSFYGKAQVKVLDNETEILYSYGTSIMAKFPNGHLYRFVDWISTTTGNHIKSFCGLDKKGFLGLEMANFGW